MTLFHNFNPRNTLSIFKKECVFEFESESFSLSLPWFFKSFIFFYFKEPMHFSTFFYSFLLKVGEYSFEEYFDGGKGETLPTSLPLFWKIFQPFPLSWGNTTLEPFEGKFGEREKEGRGKGTSSLWNDATPLSLNFPQVRMVVVQVCVVLRVGKKIPLGILHTHRAVHNLHTQVLFSPEKKGNGRESPFFYNSEKRNLLFFYLKMSSFFLFHFESGFISVCPFDETIRRVWFRLKAMQKLWKIHLVKRNRQAMSENKIVFLKLSKIHFFSPPSIYLFFSFKEKEKIERGKEKKRFGLDTLCENETFLQPHQPKLCWPWKKTFFLNVVVIWLILPVEYASLRD